jgi:hypothetical protein
VVAFCPQDPLRENTADGNEDDDLINIQVADRDAAMAAAYMDATIPPIIKADIAKGILSEKLLTSMAAQSNDTSDDAAAVEVRSVSLGKIAAAVRASGSKKNVTGLLQGIKQDVLAAVMNKTVSFDAGNNSFHLPEPLLAALAVKHNLHKGVLTTLLNKTDLGFGSVRLSTGAAGDEAYPGIDVDEPSVDPLLLLAAKKAILKGTFPAPFANVQVNSSSLGGKFSIQRVPHDIFASLVRGNGTSSGLNSTDAFVMVNSTVNGTSGKPHFKASLERLGASVKRVKRLSKSFKPALSIVTGSNLTAANGTSVEKEVKLQMKFWDRERAHP